ncbi:LAQU0S14e02498g1_1 [Lachancea quebecensis]|uniref:Dolichyl-diphosphooligosaccharide-protein glycosyltransferase subunit OST5 n=1 Tax=Lachancea quebecensis TaxID=1654605 RepID=A0A0P1KWI0_9SACH|nr:LAQU0S14e02498g1_1 [Lachancea quebecensis]
MSSYQEVYKLYHQAPEFQGVVALESQPVYGTVAAIVALVFIALALSSISKAAGLPLVIQFLKFTCFSLVGSAFFGLATIFLTNSFGVYA